LTGECAKNLKKKDSAYNDERLKFINDLIVGCRTIKCYGWENHYTQKINEIRSKQNNYVFWYNCTASLGTGLFQNFGFLAVFTIIIIKWSFGLELDNAEVISSLSMIFVVFVGVNIRAFFGLNNFLNLLMIFERLASVFKMEEFNKKREI